MENQIELRTIRIRLIVCSPDKAREIGLDGWMYDRHLALGRAGAAERDRLEQRIAALERRVGATVVRPAPTSLKAPAGRPPQRAPRARKARATLPPRGVDNAR